MLASPLLLVAAIAIKLELARARCSTASRAWARTARVFELFKLRTMRQGADPVGVGTAVIADDPRVTAARQGPAPLRARRAARTSSTCSAARWRSSGRARRCPAQVELYTPRQRRRLELKPGVTGWAQIHGRAGIPWEERIELDVWYVENRSLGLDLRILARTPVVLVAGRRASAATDAVRGLRRGLAAAPGGRAGVERDD